MIAHQRDGPAILRIAFGIAQHAANLAGVVAAIPGPVIMFQLQGIDQIAREDPGIIGQKRAAIAELPALDPCDAGRQHIVIMNVESARRAEIAHIGVIRAFFVIDPLNQFRDGEVEIGIFNNSVLFYFVSGSIGVASAFCKKRLNS